MKLELNKKLTEKKYWIETSVNYTMGRHNAHIEVVELIKKYIPKNNTGTCLEIGSFPGPFLATFGDLGYELNGIDYNPRNKLDVPLWLKKEKLKVGEFFAEDFFNFTFEKKYNVVCSFGFIEHFKNYDEVIQMHCDLNTHNGMLMITTPNFKGAFQQILHKLFDQENLKQHHIPSMDTDLWKKILIANNYEILFSGPFGGLKFWVEKSHKRNFIQKTGLWFIERIIIRMAKIIRSDNRLYSGYLGIIARKKP